MSEFRRRLMMTQKGGDIGKYIQDGLVVWLDGSDYDDTGTWVDRAGGAVFTKYGNGITSAGNGVSFSGNNKRYLSSDKIPTIPYNSSTIEVVCVCSNNNWGVIYHPNNTNFIMYAINNGRVSYIIGSNKTSKATGNTTSLFTHSVSDSHNYFNKTSMGTSGTSSWNYAALAPSVVGNYGTSNGNYGFNGTLYQLRIYNRILTYDEIMHNADIDISKYNITI